VKSKTVAFVVLLIMMTGALYATSTPIEVSSDEPVNLYNFVNSLLGTSTALGDPVPGTGSSGGDD
jgi:hypothetical protein